MATDLEAAEAGLKLAWKNYELSQKRLDIGTEALENIDKKLNFMRPLISHVEAIQWLVDCKQEVSRALNDLGKKK